MSLTPIIYTGVDFADSWLDSTVSEQWPLWMANYNGQSPQTCALRTERLPGKTGRHGNSGSTPTVQSVPGIGSVDADVYKGSTLDLKDYIIGSGHRWKLGDRVTTTTSVDAWATNAANTTFTAVAWA